MDSKTFVLLLVNKNPLSFVSGNNVNLKNVLSSYNRTEFHHLMPQSFLKKNSLSSKEINILANFAMISAADNKHLGGVAPSEYRKRMPSTQVDEILNHALCPKHDLFSDDFVNFTNSRAEMLAQAANQLMI